VDSSLSQAVILIVNDTAEITEMLVAALSSLADCPAILAVAPPYSLEVIPTLPVRLILCHLRDT
jgi:hypothetical protein